MSSAVASIEKLNGENYATWCIQVRSLLITLDLWHTVVEVCPKDNPSKWMETDMKALATITLSVQPNQLIYIKNCSTAKEAWNVLGSMYKADTASRKVNLFKRLVRYKFNSSEGFGPQLNEFVSIIDGLKEIGIELHNDLLSILLLCSLPDEMESFVVAMESRDELPKYEKLTSKILEEEMRQNNKNDETTETVFAANYKRDFKRDKKQYNSSNNYKQNDVKSTQHKRNYLNEKKYADVNKTKNTNNNNIKCFRCGKRGHIRSQCRENKDKQENDFACSLRENKWYLRDLWILDSGASSHMVNSKEYFENFTESTGQIYLASGEVINAQGFGNIKLKTNFCMLTLNNVLYVPQLHSNFLAINKIIKAGHTVQFAANKATMKSKENKYILTADLVEGIFIVNLKRLKIVKL